MIRTKRGFTLIELLIVVVAIVAVVGVVGGVAMGCVDHKVEAEAQAQKWADSMSIKATGISCVNHDTDGDGYVSCTINDGKKMHSMECTGEYSWNSGCRAPKLNLNRNQSVN